jgi:hypothetical protein
MFKPNFDNRLWLNYQIYKNNLYLQIEIYNNNQLFNNNQVLSEKNEQESF